MYENPNTTECDYMAGLEDGYHSMAEYYEDEREED